MAQITGYTFKPRAIEDYDGWDSETKTLTPMTFDDENGRDLHEALDNITLAAEAGVLDNFLWPQQIFADKDSYDWFIGELANYDECFRITDQWWTALSSLIDNVDEGDFVSANEIANKLNSVVIEDGLIKNFGRKVPVYKFTVEECRKASFEGAKHGASYGAYYQAMDNAEVRRIQDIEEFSKYYGFKLSAEDYDQATKEGAALRAPYEELEKRRAAKKVAAKKTVTKKAK